MGLATKEHDLGSEGTGLEAAAAQEGQLLLNGRRRQLPRHLANDALRRRLLAVADAVALLFSGLILASGLSSGGLWLAALLPVYVVLGKLHGLYDRDDQALRHLTVDELGSIIACTSITTALAIPLAAVTPAGSPTAAWVLRFWLSLVFLTAALRGLARFVWRRTTTPSRALLLGSGPLERTTRRKLELFDDIHVRVAGRLDIELLGREGPDTVAHVAEACGGQLPDRIVVCTPDVREARLAEVVRFCRAHRMRLSVVPPLRGAFGTAVRLSHVAELPLVEYHTGDASISTLMLKRGTDLILGVLLLVLLAPLMLVVAVAVRIDSRGPVIFRQRRAGLLGEPFTMLKFRTMVDGADQRLHEVVALDLLESPMFKLAADPRTTRVGRFLRRWSLDELPQLVNVIRGDMSLVGPRPEQIEMVERYQAQDEFRLQTRPGMTGPMQVFGRGALEFEERLAVEREYIENMSVARDLRILLMTLPAVVSGRGAY